MFFPSDGSWRTLITTQQRELSKTFKNLHTECGQRLLFAWLCRLRFILLYWQRLRSLETFRAFIESKGSGNEESRIKFDCSLYSAGLNTLIWRNMVNMRKCVNSTSHYTKHYSKDQIWIQRLYIFFNGKKSFKTKPCIFFQILWIKVWF